MQTIRLKIHDSVYEKLMWFLSKFNNDEIEVLHEELDFAQTQRYLQKELDEIESGKAEFIDLEEFEQRLDNTIKKNENRI